MSYTVLFVGFQQDLPYMEKVVAEYFDDIVPISVAVPSLFNRDIQSVAQEIQNKSSAVSGILYLRREIYLLVSKYITHPVPVRYADISEDVVRQILLRSRIHHLQPLNMISVDIFTANEMLPVLIDPDIFNINAQALTISIESCAYWDTQQIVNEHISHLDSGADIVLTNIPMVQEALLQLGRPVVHIPPNTASIIQELRSLKLRSKILLEKNRITMIYLCLHYKDTTIALNQIQFRELDELSNVTKTISLFAHTVDGAAFPISRWEYLILCDEAAFLDQTKNFSRISLMQDIAESTVFDAVLATGIGSTIKQTYQATMASYAVGVKIRNTNTVITMEDQPTLEPIVYKSDRYESRNKQDDLLSRMAKECSIQYASVQKLYLAAKQKNSNLFHSSEIASLLNISLRTANRMLERMMDQNYASLSGYTLLSERGRPSRLIRIHF